MENVQIPLGKETELAQSMVGEANRQLSPFGEPEHEPNEARSLLHLFRRDADVRDLQHVIRLLPFREKALVEACNLLKDAHPNLNEDERFALGSTDLFVEKAQLVLSRRAMALFIAGGLAVLCSVALLAASVYIIRYQLIAPVDPKLIDSNQVLALRIFQATALSAFILVGVKWLMALARNFFHEALSLHERRHALRFGRLYVYLVKGAVNEKRLEAAFQWNKESRTSFLDIKPELLADTLLHKAVSALGSLPPTTIKAFAELAEKKRAAKKRGQGFESTEHA